METRKKTSTPRMDRKGLILTVVGALLVIAIIVIAVVLMQRSGGDVYGDNYSAAMEHYIAGEYNEAIDAAKLAYAEDPTEEAALIIARSYAGLGDYENAIATLEQWVGANGSGSEAGALLEQYRSEAGNNEEDENKLTLAGEEYTIVSNALTVTGKSLSSADLQTIAEHTELTSLTLNSCSLSDVSALSALKRLTTLSLEDNNITELSPLSGLTELTALYLGGNADMGSLEPLYSLTKLTTLDISGREITDEEFDDLQEALAGCNIISDDPTATVTEISLGGQTFTSDVTELDLSNSGLTDISALAECTKLERLNLSGNGITSISALASMPGLKSLDISNNSVTSLSPLISLTSLESLNASGNQIATLSALAGHTALTTLNLDNNPLSGIEALSGLTGLTTLSLRSAGIDDADMAVLQTLTGLTSLDLDGNDGISAEAADALRAALPNCSITIPDGVYSVSLGNGSYETDAAYVDASGQEVASLQGVQHFTNLQVLVLNRNPGIDISGASELLTSVQSLSLADCGLTDVSALSGLTQLLTLDLMLNDIADISPLRYLTGLTELHLSMNERLEDISPLSTLTSLTTLSLNGTSVTDLSPISGLTSLEVLDIEGCEIEDVAALYNLKNLRTLYAAGCGLTQQQIDELGRQLPNCTIYT